jgi:quercetin dioxygenase-like cupin family protein
MKTNTKLQLAGISAAAIIAGVALATPTVGAIFNNILTTGTANQDIHAHAHVAVPESDDDGFSAELETQGASNFVVQDVIFSPGGTTGWHTHPGVLLLSLTADSGPIDWFDARCVKHVYQPGDSWTEGTTLHDVVNSSSLNAHFVVTYVIAKGMNKRIDQPAPACAAALGLN